MKDITVKRLEKWITYKRGCYMASFNPRPYTLRLGISKANAVAKLEHLLNHEGLRPS